jgi:hypothetical protein
MTAGTWATGGFKEVDPTNLPGVYQFGIPDAALVNGATEVTLYFRGATNLQPRAVKIQLTAFDLRSSGVSIASGGITSSSYASGAITSSAFAVDGTAQAGASGSITLAVGASSVNDFYKGSVITTVAGTGAGQSRLITAYNGGTKVATVDEAWATNPSSDTTYVVTSAGRSYVTSLLTAAANVIRDAVTDDVIEAQGSYTLQQALSLILAAAAGRSSNDGATFATPNNAATRIQATVDSNGNRTAITLTPSS